jgi:hypothetical protein
MRKSWMKGDGLLFEGSAEKMRLHPTPVQRIIPVVMRPHAHIAHVWFWWNATRTVGRSCADA